MSRLGLPLEIPQYRYSDNLRYQQRVKNLFGSSLIGYYPLWETSGVTAGDQSGNGRDGTYRNTAGVLNGVTLGQPGIGDGRTAPLFDGAAGYANLSVAELISAFNRLEGIVASWVCVPNIATWSDGTARDFLRIRTADNLNQLILGRTTTNNQIRWHFQSVNGTHIITDTSLNASTAWFHVATTWSKTANKVRHYLNGVQVGADGAYPSDWQGAPQTINIGNSGLDTNFHKGLLAHCAIGNTALSADSIAQLYQGGASPFEFQFAWFSDSHYEDTSWQTGQFGAFLASMASKNPSFGFGTGDIVGTQALVDQGGAATQEQVDGYNAEKAGLSFPVYELNGNHDWLFFNDHLVVDYGSIRVIGFHVTQDTWVVEAAELAWIESQLRSANGRRCILACHFPLANEIAMHIGGASQTAIINLCNTYDVRLYLSGHSHATGDAYKVGNNTLNVSGFTTVGPGKYVIVKVYGNKITMIPYGAASPFAQSMPVYSVGV